MKDCETREKFIELRVKGLSYEKIAQELGVSKQTLINWSKSSSRLINNLRLTELEVFQEKYYASKEKRIELFGKKLQAIIDEVDKRDFKNISTTELLELALKYAALLKREEVPIVFKDDMSPAERVSDFGEKNWSG